MSPAPPAATYPRSATERDRWVLAQRARADGSPRVALDPYRPYAFLREEERAEDGAIVPVATLFLTNRECPWRCLMCDLWRHTLTESVPAGAIPAQIDYALEKLAALEQLGPAPDPRQQVKLYNSGSFFDPRAIPREDHPAIATRLRGFERVIVECHPALVGDDCWRFQDLLDGQLEVAMGLETVHPEVAARLNKRMTLDQFAAAAERLREHGVALRTFILVQPPFMPPGEALYWAQRSLHFAFDRGATLAALIPTRLGNGALEALAEQGEFTEPRLATLEAALDYGINLGRGRTTADLWDLQRFATCAACFPARQQRLQQLNLHQQAPPRPTCPACGE